MDSERPNPDELLARVTQAEAKARRGRLKVLLGACAGVGKTFTMLEMAQHLRREGTDVVAGYIETHGRAETDALLTGLEALPIGWVNYRGTSVREFDLDAALARKPAVLLVDELAHTNAPGSRHAKRWQDVEALLDAGISVVTTVNIQHIDSQKDLVAQITRVTVRETVPDSVLEEADEVEVVDLPPDELLQRLQEGKVYVRDMAGQAQEHFFRKGNLIALRQLALRFTAERVDRQMQDYRRNQAIQGPWPVAERLLVGVGPSPQSPKVVRAAKRLATRLRAHLIALYVETPASAMSRPADRERVLQSLHLAEQLGAETATLTGTDVVDVMLRYARERNVSKIVMGKPIRRSWRDWVFGSSIDRMARRGGEIDIYVVKGGEEESEGEGFRPAMAPRWGPFAWGAGVVAFCTLISAALFEYLALANLVMFYLAGVVFVGLRLGHGPSILASVASVLAFDFFFVPPRFTLAVADTQYLVTFAIMLVVGLLVSTLAARTRQQVRSAIERERRTAALYCMSREVASARGTEELVGVVRKHVEDVFHGVAPIYLPEGEKRLRLASGSYGGAEEPAVAQWVFDHKEPAGLGTRTLPGSRSHNVPLQVGNLVVGVLGFIPRNTEAFLVPQQMQLLETFATLAAVALERERLARQAAEALIQVEAEKLWSALVTSISEALRTPLVAIQEVIGLLLKTPRVEGMQAVLLTDALAEAEFVNRMIANLLDLTHLESGRVEVHRDLQPLDGVVTAALSPLEGSFKDRPLDVRLPRDLPPVPLDAVLIQQVIFNLLENAIRHTPAGTPIELSASAGPSAVTIEVADRGSGLRPGDEQKVFDKFYRTTPEGKRAGMGLGLTLCEGIVRLHGGRIWAAKRPGGGALFRFTLPLGGSPPAALPPEAPSP
jgi:two-component system sensor histidine kinase KdpD